MHSVSPCACKTAACTLTMRELHLSKPQTPIFKPQSCLCVCRLPVWAFGEMQTSPSKEQPNPESLTQFLRPPPKWSHDFTSAGCRESCQHCFRLGLQDSGIPPCHTLSQGPTLALAFWRVGSWCLGWFRDFGVGLRVAGWCFGVLVLGLAIGFQGAGCFPKSGASS